MKPFNLEEAIAGKPVITRNGSKVQELVFFNYKELSEPILAKIAGRSVVLHFYRDGSYFKDDEHENDLFMADPERWINIYWDENTKKSRDGGSMYDTEEEAKKNANSCGGYLTTLKLPL